MMFERLAPLLTAVVVATAVASATLVPEECLDVCEFVAYRIGDDHE